MKIAIMAPLVTAIREPQLGGSQGSWPICVNLHGHNYVLEVVVAGEVDQATGYVVDLKVLSNVIKTHVICDVDHHNLNTDVPWLKGLIPTSENLAQAIWDRLCPEVPAGLLRAVRIWETDKNWAEVSDQA